MILVSACLAGVKCRYDRRDNADKKIIELVRQGKAIPVCPEQLGGLATPRPPAEIRGGNGIDVINDIAEVRRVNGEDITKSFIMGAREVLELAQKVNAKKIILKERSPSCGVNEIYDGSFRKKVVSGMGVTTALLLKEGFDVASRQ